MDALGLELAHELNLARGPPPPDVRFTDLQVTHRTEPDARLDWTGNTALKLQRLALKKHTPAGDPAPPAETTSPPHPADSNPLTERFATTVTDGPTGFIQADLDALPAPEGVLRGALEPGLLVAGRGITSAGCAGGGFCLTWFRPSYDSGVEVPVPQLGRRRGKSRSMASGILIVDDHAGFRAQARRLLESEGYEVVGEAPDVSSAVAAASEAAPELALVDVYLPDGNGFELTERLLELTDPPAVILVSSHGRAELEVCVDESGARGFISKAELSRQTIEEVLS